MKQLTPIRETHYSAEQAAAILGTSYRFVLECAQLGRIKTTRCGARYWFSREAVEKALRDGIPPNSLSRDVIRARRKALGMTQVRVYPKRAQKAKG